MTSYKELLEDFKQNRYSQARCCAALNETMPSNLDSIVLGKAQRWIYEYYFDEGRFPRQELWQRDWTMCLKLAQWYIVHHGALDLTGWIHHYWVTRP